MKLRNMRMVMSQGRMPMDVGMRLACQKVILVLVLVVFPMTMGVIVFHAIMRVKMAVVFREE